MGGWGGDFDSDGRSFGLGYAGDLGAPGPVDLQLGAERLGDLDEMAGVADSRTPTDEAESFDEDKKKDSEAMPDEPASDLEDFGKILKKEPAGLDAAERSWLDGESKDALMDLQKAANGPEG